MSARDRIVIGVVALIAAIAASWFLLIQPKRAELSNLNHQVAAAQTQLSQAQAALAQGQAARAQFGSSYASMVKLGEAVPTDDNVPSLIYQIQSAASASHVDFRNLALTSPTAGSGGAGQNPLPPGVTAGSSGFPVEPFSFTFRGSFFHLSDFFARLQQFVTANQNGVKVRGRLLSLDSITLGPGSGGFPEIDATVAATAYLLPQAQGLTAGATPAGPSAAGQQAGSSSTPPAGATGSAPSSGAPPAAAVTGGQP